MLNVLLKEKLWAQDWPQIIQDNFSPTVLNLEKTPGLNFLAQKINPLIFSLRLESPSSRNKIIDFLNQMTNWSESANHFMYPPTVEGWNKEFQELLAVSSLKGKANYVLPFFMASCYPKPVLEALENFKYPSEFIQQLKTSLQLTLQSGLGLSSPSDLTEKNPLIIEPENKNLNKEQSNKEQEVLLVDKKPTSFIRKPPAIAEKFQKWANHLWLGEWDDARKSEWLDSKIKWSFEQSGEASEDVWFEREVLPGLVALNSQDLETLTKFWPARKFTIRHPLEMVQTPRFWGILKSAQPEIREKLFEEVFPKIIKFGSNSNEDRLKVGQEMLRLTSNNPDEFIKRLRLWEKMGGDLDGIIPNKEDPNANLFNSKKEKEGFDTLRGWILSQNNETWMSALEKLKETQIQRPKP